MRDLLPWPPRNGARFEEKIKNIGLPEADSASRCSRDVDLAVCQWPYGGEDSHSHASVL